MTEEEQINTDLAGEINLEKNVRNKFWPFLWLLFVAVGIFLLLRHFGAAAFWNFFLALSVLGIVVIVHEFGHFMAAKLSGMKVEAFSFGFPPTLLGIKRTGDGYRIRILPILFKKRKPLAEVDEDKENEDDIEAGDASQENGLMFTFGKPKRAGETEYRISLIPFGGYVKIFGQEDIGRIKYSEDPRSYMNQSVWKRICVISAGVVFNAFLAVVLSIVVFSVGIKLIPPIVGGVAPGTPAARAGLKGGDEIIEVAGHSYNLEFTDVGMWALLSDENEAIELKVRHEDGSVEDYKIIPEISDSGMGPVRQLGINPASTLKVAKLKNQEDEELLYSETGLKPGDVIKAVNGIGVDKKWQMDEIISDLFEPTATLIAERVTKAPDGKVEKEIVETEIDLGLNVLPGADKENDMGNIYSIEPCLKVVSTTLVDVNGFVKGDVIIAAGDTPYPDLEQFRKIVESHEQEELFFRVLRADSNGIVCQTSITAVPYKDENLKRFVVGVVLIYDFDTARVAKTVDISLWGKKTAALEISPGAMITAVNGETVQSFYDFAREMKRNVDSDVTIGWRGSDGKSSETVFVSEMWANVGIVDVVQVELPFEQMQRVYRADGGLDALKMGYKKATSFIILSFTTIKQFLRGQVSPKNFMGPVGILTFSYHIVTESSRLYYLYIVALISAFIGVFNTLPILPFDGGHIVFLIIEKIKGSPVNQRIQESFSMAGFVLILILFAYITFWDVVRTIKIF